MNTKTLIIIAIVLVAMGTGIGYYWTNKTPVLPSVLTQDFAQALVISAWGDCNEMDCDNLSIEIKTINETQYIIATYNGLRDDSVQSLRITAPVFYQNQEWILGEPERTQRCQPNRGHQDFSNELCI